MTRLAFLAALVLMIPASASAQDVAITTEVISDQLDQPLFVTSPPGDSRLFVVEQTGQIRVIAGGVLQEAPFLDVSSSISAGGEQGLLGLAFHPDYANNGRFFINFTDPQGDTQIASYQIDPAAETAV